MAEKTEFIFTQVRLLRIASEKWNMSIKEASALFEKYGLLKFIEDCYGVFHMEGDYAVFEEIKTLLRNKGEGGGAYVDCR